MKSVALATLKASSLLQQGQYKRAMEMLQSSLVGLRSRIEECACRLDPVSRHFELKDDRRLHVTEIRVLALHTSLHPTEENSFPLRSQGFFALYDRSLAVATASSVELDQDDREGASSFDEHRLTAVVLYNMALCYHLRGTQQQGPSNERFMRKAIKLYNLALELLQGAPASRRNSPSDALVCLAVLNNLGHAYQNFHEVERAQCCFDQLVSVLHSGPVVAEYGAVPDLNHFALTALLHDQVFPTAPAA